MDLPPPFPVVEDDRLRCLSGPVADPEAVEPVPRKGVADLAAALGRAPGRLGRVRSDLVARGVVEPAGRGRVRFPLPGFAEYVRAAR